MLPLELCTYRSRQSPRRGCAETSSRFETVVCVVAPCISTPSTERLRSLASTARRGSVRHPKANFPCSCAGSIRAARDRSLAALPSSDISTARSFEIQHDANEELSRAERSGPRRASRATIEPSRPATLGHCPAVGREEASAVTPSLTGDGERGSRLQADYAT